MEKKTKAIAAALEIEESKLTNKVMSNKLNDLKLDKTGNKEALTNRLFDAMGFKVDDEPEKTKEEEVEKPKAEPKKTKGLKKTAGFYAIWHAGRTNIEGQEAPIFDWNAAAYKKTIAMSHGQAKLLNDQTENSGMKYILVQSKTDKK